MSSTEHRTAAAEDRSRKDDSVLRERLKALAAERRRFRYKRLAIMLKREGQIHNLKKIYRLYKEEGLSVKRCKGRNTTLIEAQRLYAAAVEPKSYWYVSSAGHVDLYDYAPIEYPVRIKAFLEQYMSVGAQ